jgi:hypothetical protein
MSKRTGRREVKRMGMSHLQSQDSKRGTLDDRKVATFLREVRYALEFELENKTEALLNADETFWHLTSNAKRQIGFTGSANRPVISTGDEKAGWTAMLTVTAAGTKLPTMMIIKGKTRACLKSIVSDDHGGKIVPGYSTSKWMNTCLFIFYLTHIVYPHMQKHNLDQCVLMSDTFGAHMTDPVLRVALALRILLIFVPENTTPLLQPLDYGIMGPLKTMGRATILADAAAVDVGRWKEGKFPAEAPVTAGKARPGAINRFVEAYAGITSSSIRHAFNDTSCLPNKDGVYRMRAIQKPGGPSKAKRARRILAANALDPRTSYLMRQVEALERERHSPTPMLADFRADLLKRQEHFTGNKGAPFYYYSEASMRMEELRAEAAYLGIQHHDINKPELFEAVSNALPSFFKGMGLM